MQGVMQGTVHGMQGMVRAASNVVSQASSAVSEKGVQRFSSAGVSPAREKAKLLLIIDEPTTDWVKFFYGRKVFSDWEIIVEQAQFCEIHLTSSSATGAIVQIRKGKHENATQRSFRPDFVLVREHARDASVDWRKILFGLQFAGVPSINSLNSIINFLDKPWVFSHLIQIQKRIGKDKFPLIDQCYYPNYKEMLVAPRLPVVVKLGHAHSGSGKVKVDNHYSFQDIASVAAVANSYSTTELLIEAQCDVYIQKIGNNCRAFMRKSVTGNWKANTGSTHLEQIQMNDRYRSWLEECSKLFGGLEMMAIQIIQAKDGKEYIIEINDSSMSLLGSNQSEDCKLIAEVVLSYMEAQCRGGPSSRHQQTSSAVYMSGDQGKIGPAQSTSAYGQAEGQRSQPVPGIGSGHPLPSHSYQQQQQRMQQPQQQPYQQQQHYQQQQPQHSQFQQQSSQPQRQPFAADSQINMNNQPGRSPQSQRPQPPIGPPQNQPAGPPGVAPFRSPSPAQPQNPQGSASGQGYAGAGQGGGRGPQRGEEGEDTMNNLKKTFAGIFGNI